MCVCVKSLYMSGFHQLRGLRLHPLGVQVAGFRLPLNARGPIVMVAAGTGLAPMRGFLQLRAALKLEGRVGPMALVFGCRKKSDLLCR